MSEIFSNETDFFLINQSMDKIFHWTSIARWILTYACNYNEKYSIKKWHLLNVYLSCSSSGLKWCSTEVSFMMVYNNLILHSIFSVLIFLNTWRQKSIERFFSSIDLQSITIHNGTIFTYVSVLCFFTKIFAGLSFSLVRSRDCFVKDKGISKRLYWNFFDVLIHSNR